MQKSSNTEHVIYCFVCDNPGQSTYSISKYLKMSGGRVRHALKCLERDGFIKFKFDKTNTRIKKLSFPNNTWELMPKDLKNYVKKIK